MRSLPSDPHVWEVPGRISRAVSSRITKLPSTRSWHCSWHFNMNLALKMPVLAELPFPENILFGVTKPI